MVLHKLEDFDPEYRNTFADKDIKGLGVYSDINNEKIGTVHDALVDDGGSFRYLVVDLGFWIFGKKVLLPIGRTRMDYGADRVYALGLTREQAENLPEFHERLTTDYDYEEQVRGVYRQSDYRRPRVDTIETPTPVESSAVLESPTPVESTQVSTTKSVPQTQPTYTRDTYRYENEPDLFELNEANHQVFRLYQERLIANKHRRKRGEVAVGKHIETDTARVAVPVEREHVIIEHLTPEDAGRKVSPSEVAFREGEVARMEIYEETPEVRKEAFVREEVRVKKVVEEDTVETQDTVRREELDVNAPNLPIREER
jgi:uncharacterized protein (TIGR02271 family)